MTPMQLRGLLAIATADNGRLHIADFRTALRSRAKGFYVVMHRMVEAGLVETVSYGGDTHLVITEAGRTTLIEHGELVTD